MVNKPGPIKQPKKGPKLSPRQINLLKEIPRSKTIGEAAKKAGYAPKHARQGGHQALQQMRGRIPDLMDRLGLTEEFLIDRHLRRHLTKTKTVFIREDVIEKVKVGRRIEEVVRHVVKKYTMDDNAIQLQALDKALLIQGSYAPRDPREAAQFGVKVVVMDMPRPRLVPIDVGPGPLLPHPEEAQNNGNKKNGNRNDDDDEA